MNTRPREIRFEKTRESILDTAAAMIAERGHENVSLRAIARKVNFSAAAIYEYFDSKDCLLGAVADRARGRLAMELRGARRGDVYPDENRLVAMGMAYVTFARQYPADFLLLFRPGRTGRDEKLPKGSPYFIFMEQVVEGINDGQISPTPQRGVQQIAYGLWAAAHGTAMLQITHLAGIKADFEAADLELFRRWSR